MRFGNHSPVDRIRRMEGYWVARVPIGSSNAGNCILAKRQKVSVQQICAEEWDFRITLVPGPPLDWSLLIY